MRFESATRQRWVELLVQSDEVSGDLRVDVELHTPALSARTSAWIHREAWDAFAAALESLERQRAGTAHLTSMSPGKLELTVRALDRAGHVGVEGLVGRQGADAWQARFSVFGVDPTALPELVRHARAAR